MANQAAAHFAGSVEFQKVEPHLVAAFRPHLALFSEQSDWAGIANSVAVYHELLRLARAANQFAACSGIERQHGGGWDDSIMSDANALDAICRRIGIDLPAGTRALLLDLMALASFYEYH